MVQLMLDAGSLMILAAERDRICVAIEALNLDVTVSTHPSGVPGPAQASLIRVELAAPALHHDRINDLDLAVARDLADNCSHWRSDLWRR